MIAFITINNGLVPLIQKSMRSNLDYQRFEIISGLRSHLSLFFFGRENMLYFITWMENIITWMENMLLPASPSGSLHVSCYLLCCYRSHYS